MTKNARSEWEQDIMDYLPVARRAEYANKGLIYTVDETLIPESIAWKKLLKHRSEQGLD